MNRSQEKPKWNQKGVLFFACMIQTTTNVVRHDRIYKIWNLDGEILYEMQGEKSFNALQISSSDPKKFLIYQKVGDFRAERKVIARFDVFSDINALHKLTFSQEISQSDKLLICLLCVMAECEIKDETVFLPGC